MVDNANIETAAAVCIRLHGTRNALSAMISIGNTFGPDGDITGTGYFAKRSRYFITRRRFWLMPPVCRRFTGITLQTYW